MKNTFVLIVFTLILCAGCGGNQNRTPEEHIFLEEPLSYESIISDYYLQPGDVMSVTFFQNPELNENLLVRPDGRISLQLINEIDVAGLTPMQVQKLLNEKYIPYLKKPMASVAVQSFGGQKVFVGGQVNAPGVITISGKTTVLQAIFYAGGVRSDATISNVIIISRGHDNNPVSRELNLKKAAKGNLSEEEILIRPYDIIYVPKSLLVKGNQFIEHAYSLIPRNLWLGFAYELHPEKAPAQTQVYAPPDTGLGLKTTANQQKE